MKQPADGPLSWEGRGQPGAGEPPPSRWSRTEPPLLQLPKASGTVTCSAGASTSAGAAAGLCQGPFVRFYEPIAFDVPKSPVLLPVSGFYLSGELAILCPVQRQRQGPAGLISGPGHICR